MGNDEVGDLVAYGSCAKLDKAYIQILVTMDVLHELISQGILPDYKSKTGINSSS